METKRRIFFDLDCTLYNTGWLMADLRKDILKLGYPAELIDAGFDQLNDVGYSLEGHLRLLGHPEDDIPDRANELQFHLSYGQKYLMPGVVDGLVLLKVASELHLLTFGYQPYQRAKFAGLKELAGTVFADAHFVWKGETKGEVIARFGRETETWFLDDSPQHLEDACQKAPWIKAVRIMWPDFNPRPHFGDHIRWDVVRNFEEFIALVKRNM
jgi:FMN phosphatase YigB (HAD superfamily)